MKKSFQFDKANYRWRFTPPGFNYMTISSAISMIQVNGKNLYPADADSICIKKPHKRSNEFGFYRCLPLEFFFKRAGIVFHLEFEVPTDETHLFIQARIINRSSTSVSLGDCNLLLIDGKKGGKIDLGPKPDQTAFFRFLMWDVLIKSISSDGGKHIGDHIGLFYNAEIETALAASFVTLNKTYTKHLVEYKSKKGIQQYRVYNEFMDHSLPPGADINSDKLHIKLYKDPFLALEAWAEMIKLKYQPKLNPKTTVGWMGWSWVDCFSEREPGFEKIMLQNAVAIKKRLAGFNIDYIWMSQVNLKDMLPGNWLEFNDKHFPNGFKNALKILKKMGFNPGLWIAPFWVFGDARKVAERNQENFVRNKNGSIYIKKMTWEFSELSLQPGHKHDLFMLDGAHPETLKFISEVFREYRRLGIRYFMLDFLGVGMEHATHNPWMTGLEGDRAAMEQIRKIAGPDTHLQTAVGSTPQYTGCVDAARINTDYGEGRPLYPPYHCHYNATSVINDKLFGSPRRLLRNVAGNYFTHRKLYINDYNFLTVDKPIPRSLAEISTTIFGLSGSPITLGDDISKIHPERLALIKKCLPRTDKVAFPVDLFEHVYPENYCRMLMLKVKTEWVDYLLLAVFNFDDTTYCETINFKDLKINLNTKYRIFDFWNEEYIGTFTKCFGCEVPSGTCRLFRISEAKEHPWFLSSDMHIQQGYVEIKDMVWNEKKLVLKGSVSRPKGETGNLYFLMPPGYRLINHENHWLVKDSRDMSVIIRKEIIFTKQIMNWALRFAPLKYTTVY